MNFLFPGKASFVIDGQFGSTGKGLISGYIAHHEAPDVAVSCASANAGHTYIGPSGHKIVAFHLPISGILHKGTTIYLGAGSIIDPSTLLKEIADYGVDRERVFIHPRAAIINASDVENEMQPNSMMKKIGSTQHGVGQALVRKILRTAILADKDERLKYFVKKLDLNLMLTQGAAVMVEVPQGYGLGINSGYSYPYCTSREISVPQAMADAQIHPKYLGKVIMTMRTFPIRVGGTSGPFYPDSEEITWEKLGLEPEITTVTKRIRRVATFSMQQYQESLNAILPDYIFLNFVNYLEKEDQKRFINKIGTIRYPTHIGSGPKVTDVYLWERKT